jgi:hypothetical protein
MNLNKYEMQWLTRRGWFFHLQPLTKRHLIIISN